MGPSVQHEFMRLRVVTQMTSRKGGECAVGCDKRALAGVDMCWEFELECVYDCGIWNIERRPSVENCGCEEENPVMNDYKQSTREGVWDHRTTERDMVGAQSPWEKRMQERTEQ